MKNLARPLRPYIRHGAVLIKGVSKALCNRKPHVFLIKFENPSVKLLKPGDPMQEELPDLGTSEQSGCRRPLLGSTTLRYSLYCRAALDPGGNHRGG